MSGSENSAPGNAAGGINLEDFASDVGKTDVEPNDSGIGGDKEVINVSAIDQRQAILDVPVKITAVVGNVSMPVKDLLKLGRGAIVKLNKRLGESTDIYANDRLIARGEILIVDEDHIAVNMTEIMTGNN
ncbi:flagellar motor switch protein FliN [Acetobacter pasteurianus]|uniref:Flagellar motor switch protein FliN n=1 Tax=Acetobacter pasteurianus NBRC 3188 TaxID=1226663 RepID=A0A401WXR6_ACEPA|nr:flagellar motor switch protein FliN [Acetobacter pasteurianus]QHM90212.1 flagellar motor switch protein FliN [Acetobacter pasteurianus]GCD54147.1 flagellar motor switch protein [Acetobacter pasteurianus NBRC 3188]